MSADELELVRQSGQWKTFRRWKRSLLVAGPYWDFSEVGGLAGAEKFFLDVVHFKPAVGQVVLRTVLGEDCSQCGESAREILDTARWVDGATIDPHLTPRCRPRPAERRRAARVARAALDDVAQATPQAGDDGAVWRY